LIKDIGKFYREWSIGRIPTRAEYLVDMGVLAPASEQVYQYLNFDKIVQFNVATPA